LGVSIAVLGSQPVTVYVEICVAETSLKIDGDRICDAVKLPVALCLCSFETTGNMAPDEGHRDGCRGIGSKNRVRREGKGRVQLSAEDLGVRHPN